MPLRKPSPKNKPSSMLDEQSFRLLFDGHSAIMLLIEPETGAIQDANQAAVDFYGYSKAKLCGMAIQEINTLSPEQVADERQKAFAEARNYFVFPHRLASGEERIVEVHSSSIVLQKGQVLFSIIHDITERKQMEKQSLLKNLIVNTSANAIKQDITARTRLDEALRESDRFARSIVDALVEKIAILDESGSIVAVNRAWRELAATVGQAPVTVCEGANYLEVCDATLGPDAVYARAIAVGIRAVINREQSEFSLEYPGDFCIDSTIEKRWFSAKVTCFAGGGAVRVIIAHEDITARKQAEMALLKSEEKYRLIAENTSDGIIHFGADNHIQYVSPAYLNQLGYSEITELTRTPDNIYLLIHPEERETIFSNIFEAIKSKKSGLSYSYRVKHTAGHYIWREDNAKFNYDHSGIYSGSYVICRDITKRKQSEESIRQRVQELETINRISLAMRGISGQVEMLSKVLDEILAILNTAHGSIELFNPSMKKQGKTVARGWMAQVTELAVNRNNDLASKVINNGEIYTSREFASDPRIRLEARTQIPPGWGGASLPIRTTQQALGVLTVCVPSERELDKDELRLLSIVSDMTGATLHRMQLNEQTAQRLENLQAMRAVDQAISSSHDLDLTLNILMMQTISQLAVDAADVLLLRPGSQVLELAAEYGFQAIPYEKISLIDSFAGRALREHCSLFTFSAENPALREFPEFEKLWKEEGFACFWCVPLIVKGEVKGVLEVYRRTPFSPESEWLEFLETLAGQAAIAIDNSQLFETLQRANQNLSLAYDATIEGWSRALDLRDHETEGHTLRVTDLTVKLARAMHISESHLSAIRRGTLLHDIGKMGVPDDILLKAGPLTDEEWIVMRKHPQYAYDMLAPIAYLKDSIDIPYCHHEKWNGTGYPQGLRGDQIPLSARIFAIVDVWDALTSDRPYRSKWTIQKTRLYIQEQSGKQFDPQVVDIFLKRIDSIYLEKE